MQIFDREVNNYKKNSTERSFKIFILIFRFKENEKIAFNGQTKYFTESHVFSEGEGRYGQVPLSYFFQCRIRQAQNSYL